MNNFLIGLGLLITAATPIILALINRKQRKMLANSEVAKQASVHAAEAVETVRERLAITSNNTDEKLEHIKVSVNSERTAMIERLEAMHAEILNLRTLLTPEQNLAVATAARNIQPKE